MRKACEELTKMSSQELEKELFPVTRLGNRLARCESKGR